MSFISVKNILVQKGPIESERYTVDFSSQKSYNEECWTQNIVELCDNEKR